MAAAAIELCAVDDAANGSLVYDARVRCLASVLPKSVPISDNDWRAGAKRSTPGTSVRQALSRVRANNHSLRLGRNVVRIRPRWCIEHDSLPRFDESCAISNNIMKIMNLCNRSYSDTVR